jgi:cytidylate kinase
MTDIFYTLLSRIIKEQNKLLLRHIAEKYNKNYEDLERKYLTPSFYSLDINKTKIYDIDIQIHESNSNSKIIN